MEGQKNKDFGTEYKFFQAGINLCLEKVMLQLLIFSFKVILSYSLNLLISSHKVEAKHPLIPVSGRLSGNS
jgi:hypothetical protein